ncbi:MFS transporter [Chloroflexota bacterium]
MAAGFCVWVVAWGMHQSFGVFFTPLLTEFGWSRAGTVLAYSLLSITQAAVAIIMGWLTDKLGPRFVVTVFGSFLGISYLLMSQVNALWQFQVNYALVAAIGFSTTTVPIMATVARWFVKKRGLMTAIVQAGLGIGGFIFAPMTGWLIINYGWRSAYSILGIVALVVIIMSGLLLRRQPTDVGQLPGGTSSVGTLAEKEPQPGKQATGHSLREAVRTGQFWLVTGLYFSFGFCRSTFLPHIAPHTQDLGFSLSDGANVVAVLTISSIFGRLWMGWLSNKPAFMISYGVTTVALVWALVTRELGGIYLFAAIFGFGWGAQAVLRFTVAAETSGLVSLGLIMGVFTFAEASAGAFGSFIAGYMFDVFGSYQPAFWMGIPVSITGILLASFLKLSPKRE